MLEEGLALVADTILDFIPGGKAMKLFRGVGGDMVVNSIKKTVKNVAAKKARQIIKKELPAMDPLD
jgi:hypothetical protein